MKRSISAGRGKGLIVHQLSTPRRVKEITEISTKRSKEITEISTKRRWKSSQNIKHCKTTVGSVFVWTEHRQESLVTCLQYRAGACHTNPHSISFTFPLLVLKAALHLPFSLLTKLMLFKPKNVLERWL